MNKQHNINLLCALILLGVLLSFCTTAPAHKLTTKINENTLEVSLKALSDSTYTLQMNVNGEKHSEWPLNYPVYRFDYGDITGDGIPEIAVGVIKPTRFDPTPNKRLFLFKITDQFYIRPLWLGSRVAQPLVDFCITNENDSAYIRTIELEQSGKFLVARYYWKRFGISFNDYVKREITESKAKELLQN